MQAFLSRVPKISNLKITKKNQATLCTAVYKRLQAVENYDTTQMEPIATPITLFKPTQPTIRSLPEDYLLGQVYN